jgi:hypothetical protein
VGVDGPLEGLEGDAVDRVKELAPGQDAPGLAREGEQELELGRREVDPTAADGHPQPRYVQLQVADADHVGMGKVPADSAQDGPHPGHQFARAEWLGQVVVGAQLEPDELVGFVGAGGQDDDGDGGLAADGAGDVESVEAGQPQVEHEQIRLPGPRRGQRGGTVGRGEDVEARVLEVVPR